MPCTYDGSVLNGADHVDMPARTRPGSPCPDAPLGDGWLLTKLGQGFMLLAIGVAVPDRLTAHGLTVPSLILEPSPEIAARYLGAAKSAVYLIRPDQHVAARWDRFNETGVAAALAQAIGKV
jgi:3-(3-hydroxy-phenyl)propionate hydroxylase